MEMFVGGTDSTIENIFRPWGEDNNEGFEEDFLPG